MLLFRKIDVSTHHNSATKQRQKLSRFNTIPEFCGS